MRLPSGPQSPALMQAFQWGFAPLSYLLQARRDYGDVFTMRFTAANPIVSFSHPDAIRDIFKSDPCLLRGGEANQVLEPVFGRRSLLLLDGEEHRQHRHSIVPLFHGDVLDKHAKEIKEAAHRRVDKWLPGQQFNLLPQIEAISLDVILRVLFGSDEPALRTLFSARLAALNPDLFKVFIFLSGRLPPLGRFDPRQKFEKARDSLRDLVVSCVKDPPASEQEYQCVLWALREGPPRPLPPKAISDELITLLISGRESVAFSLAWSFELLFGSPVALGRAVQHARMEDRAYLTSLIQESLRLRPVLPLVSRRLARPARIAGVELPKGTTVAANVFLAHMRAESFPDPLAFRPERFLEKPPQRFSWLPFGGGPRKCAGAAFAMLEMQIVLQVILGRADLRPLRRAPARVEKQGFSLVPRGDVPVLVQAVRGR